MRATHKCTVLGFDALGECRGVRNTVDMQWKDRRRSEGAKEWWIGVGNTAVGGWGFLEVVGGVHGRNFGFCDFHLCLEKLF